MNQTEQSEALKLADEIGEDYCNCLPAYKDRGRTDPECESCNTEDWRHRAAAELRKQYEENVRLEQALKMEEAVSFRKQLNEVQAENEALRGVLKAVMALPAINNSEDGTMEFYLAVRNADAALARAGGEK